MSRASRTARTIADLGTQVGRAAMPGFFIDYRLCCSCGTCGRQFDMAVASSRRMRGWYCQACKSNGRTRAFHV